MIALKLENVVKETLKEININSKTDLLSCQQGPIIIQYKKYLPQVLNIESCVLIIKTPSYLSKPDFPNADNEDFPMCITLDGHIVPYNEIVEFTGQKHASAIEVIPVDMNKIKTYIENFILNEQQTTKPSIDMEIIKGGNINE